MAVSPTSEQRVDPRIQSAAAVLAAVEVEVAVEQADSVEVAVVGLQSVL